MKNFFFVSLFVIFSCAASQGQISLEANYPELNSDFYSVRFGLAGDKYVYFNHADTLIEIYSLSHTLEKSISIPSVILGSYWWVRYISDNLFDLDSAVEYVLTVPDTAGFLGSHLYVIKEDGAIVFDRDSMTEYYADDPFFNTEFGLIVPNAAGTKMIFRQANSGWLVYSLPGSLPCNECSSGYYSGNFPVTAGNTGNQNSNKLSNPYPNPTSNLTRIDYQLPDGINQGELVFYNTLGNEVKRFKVTSTFGFIYVSAQDLASGTYYYNLQTSAGGSEGKKMVVIR